MHEWSTSPVEALKMMLGAAPTPDYLMDTRNNAYGAQLGMQARSQAELEDMVQREAERAQLNAPADRAALLKPAYAQGGSVKDTKVLKSGEGLNELTKQYPELSGFLQSFMGTAPDEMRGSVLDPLTARRRAGAEYGFPAGVAAQVAPGLGPLAKLAGRGAGAVARGGAEQIARAVEAGHPLTTGFAPMNVVKPKGGQWLSGSVEKALEGLGGRMNTMTETPQVLQKYGLTSSELTAIPLPERVKMYEEFLTPANRAAQSMDKFVEGPLTKYVKTQMATPEDPVRAMAERGVLHYAPGALAEARSGGARQLANERVAQGFPAQGVAESDLAKRYEQASDALVRASKAGYETSSAATDPWLLKVPPETPVNLLHSSASGELGFKHLTDELKNALNPESGLPRHLLLTPEQMQGYGVEKAVQRVADINAWREAQKVAADEKLATSPAAVMFKEYPGEANPRGLHWRELKQPEMPIEGSIVENPNPQFGTPFEYVAPDGTVLRRERTRAELEKNIARDAKAAGYKPLQEQLKYEGDTMGHCVGGYCDEVASGEKRIYSLRDAKGQPHVTIETSKPYGNPSYVIESEISRLLKERNLPPHMGGSVYDEAVANLKSNAIPERIVQIKGKGNRAPKEEYLPMVQDFVKSGKWSDVGDLQNAGLIDARAAGKPLPGRPSFMTNEEFKAFQNETRNPEPGFAAGGLVNDSISGYNPARVDEIVNSLRTELFQ
jgi:hypothetical protein